MGNETMDLEQLASYLQRDVREVTKLASRGHLPGRKVGGEWRFARAEINTWLETQLPDYTDQELTALERGSAQSQEPEPLVSQLLSEATIAVPLAATTRASVLKELVTVAEPGALLSFTGPRVVQQTTREKLPDDFGLAESNYRFGHVDAIVPRPDLRTFVAQLLRLFGRAG